MSMNRSLNPYPLERQFEGQVKLRLGARITSSSGWLDLNDGETYQLEASSFADRAVSWRKREVQSDYVEGTFVTNAVRENVVEALSVWVRADTYYELEKARERLEDALCQLTFRIAFRTTDATRYWDCTVADYTVATQREFMHSRLCLVKAQVPRHPTEQLVITSADDL